MPHSGNMYIWVKLAPNLALFAAAFCALAPTGSNFETLPSYSHALSPSLSLPTSVLSNDLMDQAYIKAIARLRDKMASPLLRSQISCRGTSNLETPAMATASRL